MKAEKWSISSHFHVSGSLGWVKQKPPPANRERAYQAEWVFLLISASTSLGSTCFSILRIVFLRFHRLALSDMVTEWEVLPFLWIYFRDHLRSYTVSPNISQLFDTNTFFWGPIFLSPDHSLRYIVLYSDSNISFDFTAKIVIFIHTAKYFEGKIFLDTFFALIFSSFLPFAFPDYPLNRSFCHALRQIVLLLSLCMLFVRHGQRR